MFSSNVLSLSISHLSQLYQEQCQDPPLGFNMPPMSGKIAWSRQLYRHIEQPMELLKVQEFLLGTSQGRSVVRKYNRIALVLTEFEILHYQRWVDIVEIGQKNLQVNSAVIKVTLVLSRIDYR